MSHPLGSSLPASPVLDHVDQTGALVIFVEPEQQGLEYDVRAAAGGGVTHAVVRERHLGPRRVYCAVYPGLAAGDYVIVRPDRTVAGTATVVRGAITEVASA